MELIGSLPCSQEPAIGFCPEPDESSPQFLHCFSKIILQCTCRSSILWYADFLGWRVIGPNSAPSFEDHPLLALCDCFITCAMLWWQNHVTSTILPFQFEPWLLWPIITSMSGFECQDVMQIMTEFNFLEPYLCTQNNIYAVVLPSCRHANFSKANTSG